MAYLELSPMIAALRECPEDFEIDRGWLTHFPSRHSYKIDSEGNVRLHAHCDCAFLSIRCDDGLALWKAYQEWRQNYWRPIEINREFASHFGRPNVAQRFLRSVLRRIRALVLDPTLEVAPINGEPGSRIAPG